MSDIPINSLPSWQECEARVDNREYLEGIEAIKDGVLIDDFYSETLLPDPIHEFIYEYDDTDPVRSAWFLHRLELLINYVERD